MARLRWGAEAPNDSNAARTRLVDAAEECFRKYGVMKTTIEDVAADAKVSRATVYRYFANRDELILGVLLREGERFLGRLAKKIATAPNIESSIVDGVLYTVKAVRNDANLALLFAPDTAGITTSIAGASEALFSLTADFLRPYFEAAQASGAMRTDIDINDAAEWTLRAILSLVTVSGPRRRTERELRAFLRTFLVRSLVAAEPATKDPRASRRQPG
jgi:AcrR family transcriptional regulator